MGRMLLQVLWIVIFILSLQWLHQVNFLCLVAPWGVTTVIADPHEIANVAGEKGLKFMLEDSKNSPIDIEFMLPSCVPATPFDDSGAVIDGDLTKELLSKYDFKGLGEMMNSVGVVNCDEDIMKKLVVTV